MIMMMMMTMMMIIIIIINIVFFRDIVWLRNVCINTLHKGDSDYDYDEGDDDNDNDDDNNNNNNNNNLEGQMIFDQGFLPLARWRKTGTTDTTGGRR
jgi:hypothetical protein